MSAVPVTRLVQLADKRPTSFVIGDVKLFLYRDGNKVSAYEDKCPHLGQKLSDGDVADGVLTCPAHHWQFDAASGNGVNPKTACLKRYGVEIRSDAVWVELEPAIRPAGPVLLTGAVANAVIQAIRDRNEGVVLIDRGAYIRIEVPGRCVLLGADVAKHLGQPFALPSDLELIMPSFQGQLKIDSDAVNWEAS